MACFYSNRSAEFCQAQSKPNWRGRGKAFYIDASSWLVLKVPGSSLGYPGQKPAGNSPRAGLAEPVREYEIQNTIAEVLL
jgi:hypothetical protein